MSIWGRYSHAGANPTKKNAMVSASGPRLMVELFRRFRVLVDGQEVDPERWPGRRSAELVQLLTLSEGSRLHREQVMEALWPDLSLQAAAANMRKAAHHARQAMGSREAVVLRGGTVSLAPTGTVDSDVAAFESAAADALDSGEAAAARAALALHDGELLPESRYEEWAEPTRRHVKALRLRLLRTAGMWEDIVEIEPTDEAAYRELMREELQKGNRPQAIRWYGRLRTILATEFGVRPDPETEATYEDCVGGLGRPEPELVGRDNESALIAYALAGASQGEVRALLLRGPAGIGKSSLCRYLAALAATRRWEPILVDGAGEAGPYGALLAAAEQMLANDRARVTGARVESDALAALASWDEGSAPSLSRHRLMGAFRRIVAGRGAPGVVLILDDADVADDATLDVLMELACTPGNGLLVVFAFRLGKPGSLLAEGSARLMRSGRAMVVDIGPLDPGASAALVSKMAKAEAAEADMARIIELAEGNPFFILELAACVEESGRLMVASTVWDAIRSRLVEVDEGSAAMLDRLALVGGEFDTSEVLAVTGLPDSSTCDLLDRALDLGILVVADGKYRFRHELLRQALAERVAPHRQVAVYRDAARRLSNATGSAERIAQLWLAGDRPDDAVPWLLRAADHASRVGAFADALCHVDLLLECQPDHGEALLLRADALAALGDSRAVAAYGLAAGQFGGNKVDDIRARQALTRLKAGDPAGALETLEGVAPTTIIGRIEQALTLSGAAAVGFGDVGIAYARAAEARQLAIEVGDLGAVTEATWALSLSAHARGDLPSRLRSDLSATKDLSELAVRVFDGHLCASERLLYGARPYDEVVGFAESLGGEAKRIGAVRGEGFAVTLAGEAELLSGRLEDAERDLDLGIQLNRSIGAAAGEALALERRAEVEHHRGRPLEAQSMLTDALAAARDSYLGHHLFDRIYGARITICRDPVQGLAVAKEAENAVRGPGETCPTCRITLEAPAAIAAAQAGDVDSAERHASMVRMLVDVIVPLPGWQATAEEVHGHLARARGDEAEARSCFALAVAGFRAIGQPLDEQRCMALL